MAGLISAETMKAHRAVWYVWAGDGSPGYPRQKIRRQATMRGFWGYDATCSCGEFETRTGGGTRQCIEDELWSHRFSAQTEMEASK
jgi:hypothetical protein